MSTEFKVGDNVTIHWGVRPEQGTVTRIDESSVDEYAVVCVTSKSSGYIYWFSANGFYTSDENIKITKDKDMPVSVDGIENDLSKFADWIRKNFSEDDYDHHVYLAFADGLVGNVNCSLIERIYKEFKNESDPQYQEYLRLKAIYG